MKGSLFPKLFENEHSPFSINSRSDNFRGTVDKLEPHVNGHSQVLSKENYLDAQKGHKEFWIIF